MDTTFTSSSFTTRESYLQYRADWKKNYANLSAQIRATKIELKEANRQHEWRKLNTLRYQLETFKRDANFALSDLAFAKERAAELRQASIEAKV